MNVGSALYGVLSVHVGLNALVSRRIYPCALPRSVDKSSVVYTQLYIKPIHAGGADIKVQAVTFQINSWADSYTNARAIATQVEAALRDYTGTSENVVIQRIFMEDERDLYENEDREWFGVSQDYVVWHEF